jgi:membrane protease YdiL (CAAX protease family)
MTIHTAFAGFLLVYTAGSVVANLRAKRLSARRHGYLTYSLQLPLFVTAVGYTWVEGLLDRGLVNPFAWVLGLLSGHLVFGISDYVMHQDTRAVWRHLRDVYGLYVFLREHPPVLFRFLLVSTVEEIIYRAALLTWCTTWMGAPTAIFVTALVFSIVHRHFFENSLRQSLEFFIFALLLGWVYYATGSLAVVIAIHAVRNIQIAYLEYLLLYEETGDEEIAEQGVEAQLIHETGIIR